MKARSIIAFLLALLITQATAIRPASAQEESPQVDSKEELKLTPEEEREVRAVVARFSERLRETNDFKQIIDEMFVKDFRERLWQVPTNELPWAFLAKRLIALSDREVLLRYYVAVMSFYESFFRLHEVVQSQKKPSEKDEDEKSVLDALSPEIINVLLSDPIIAEIAEDIKKEDENEGAQEGESRQPAENRDSAQAAGATSQTDDEDSKETGEVGIIKSLWQLNGVTTTFEKANELMRKRLASMPPIPTTTPGVDDTKSQPGLPEIYLTTLYEDEYGYPKGTRIARIKLLPFALTLTRIDGQFKVLTVTVYVD